MDDSVRRSPRTGLPIIKKAPPRRSARCGEPPPPDLLQGIAQFNAGDYWHCHETLEAIWREEADPIRSLYQGVLLAGVGYFHLQRGNVRGARAKFAQSLERLAPFRPACMGVDVEGLAKAVEAVLPGLASSHGDHPLGAEPARIVLLSDAIKRPAAHDA